MEKNNILDNLFKDQGDSDGDDNEDGDLVRISGEIKVPKRCLGCKTAIICSVLPTFVSLSKIYIYLTIDQCPYSQPLKNVEQKSSK